jgi:FeS assembly SUF system regulator
MLRITKLADYGFVLLIRMAGDAVGTTHNARDLAAAARLPLPMVSKILKALARGEILHSQRGTKGGYQLARPPESITAADVITTLDGPIMVTECLNQDDHTCDHEAGCPVKTSWRRLNDAISGALHAITLAEMARPADCCGALPRPAENLSRSRAMNPSPVIATGAKPLQ